MYAFSYLRPKTVAEAVAMLREHPEAKPISGGMTLIPTLKQRLSAPSHLVDLSRLPETQGISRDGNVLRIGGTSRHAAVADSDIVRNAIPALADLAGLIGDQQVRNRGTMGGSVANSDPGADYPAAVLGLNATVITDRRRIAADDFFTGMFETSLDIADGEIIVGFEYPIPARAVYRKHRHPASGYAVVGVMISETDGNARVAVTGAGHCAFRWTKAEEILSGHAPENWSSKLLADMQPSSATLNDDLSATPAYRAHLVATLTRRAVDAIDSSALEKAGMN